MEGYLHREMGEHGSGWWLMPSFRHITHLDHDPGISTKKLIYRRKEKRGWIKK
jgi:hypothetical protein